MRRFLLPLLGLLALRSFGDAAEEFLESPNAAPARSPVEEIIVVIKTHFDIGYTHRVSELVHYYRTDMIDKAMDISTDEHTSSRRSWTDQDDCTRRRSVVVYGACRAGCWSSRFIVPPCQAQAQWHDKS